MCIRDSYVFYLFYQPPVFHNRVLKGRAMETREAPALQQLDQLYDELYRQKRNEVDALVDALHDRNEEVIKVKRAAVLQLQRTENELRDSVKKVIAKAIPGAKTQDRDYIFLNFVLSNLPHGIIGLLLAVMFSAAMSSMAGELNALASTTSVDMYKRSVNPHADPYHYVKASKWFTVMWAILAMIFAMLASFAENLIQFVNIVGSLFYGTILGIFLAAFYVKRVGGTAVFWAAIISEGIVFYCYRFTDLAFLLYNIIGCLSVILLSLLFQVIFRTGGKASEEPGR